jgi:hypothetical protein
MLIVAYLSVVAAVIWVLADKKRFSAIRRVDVRFRIVAAGIGAALALLGLILISGGHAETLGKVVLGTLVFGAVVYVLGVLSWDGAGSYRLRRIGWVAMTLALLVPSTLSLALPAVALLALTLRRSSDGLGERISTAS